MLRGIPRAAWVGATIIVLLGQSTAQQVTVDGARTVWGLPVTPHRGAAYVFGEVAGAILLIVLLAVVATYAARALRRGYAAVGGHV